MPSSGHGPALARSTTVLLVWERYAAKFRRLLRDEVDLGTEARFIDMLLPRGSTVLDLGCGTGSTVAHLRAAGHTAFGTDPHDVVLDVARDHFDEGWYRSGHVADLAKSWLDSNGLPTAYDAVSLLGNVPAFLPPGSAPDAVVRIASILRSGGLLIVGTSPGAGHVTIADLDRAARPVGLRLVRRFGDWHLAPYQPASRWSVSIFKEPNGALDFGSPDGIFALGE